MKNHNLLLVVLLGSLAIGCGQQEQAVEEAGGTAVTAERLLNAASDASNWLSHGRTYDEQRYSPLDAIKIDNVTELGLAWYFDVPTKRGMEATPIVVDGRMYVTGSWSIVYALDAATGKELWRYDPQVPKPWAQYGCCDVVNRGVAIWGDSVYLGTFDGYLVALDADTGSVQWRVDTINRQPPYTITGAPRVINGLVIIGNGGADLGVRGYVTAYDAISGEQRWRFHTVPGNPADGFENDAMAKAAETWNGEWWKYGGGGTVWDSMAYDAELDLLYIGVGNGSPWNQRIRSPSGGDNLFLSSIVALRPDTGEYVWHYQTTPGESWDFTATQHMILADLPIDGRQRKVLMQAPKNGFFYVLDRTNGELISAEPYVATSWATAVDENSGRPIEVPGARYEDGVFVVKPSGLGGHNWQSMAFDPTSKLIFLPSQDFFAPYSDEPDYQFTEGFWNTGVEFETLETPADPTVASEVARSMTGQLVAWNPVAQKEVWRYQHAGPWNGGALATAGNLVFQGSLIGEFAAYDARNGERLWQFPSQTGIAAAPASYSVGDEQHIAVAAGWGSIFGLLGSEGTASLGLKNRSRILAFKLGGSAALPAIEEVAAMPIPEPPSHDASPEQLAHGKDLFYERCMPCHGIDVAGGGVLPDLRRASSETHDLWDGIVLGGAYQGKGMPAFGQIFNKDDSDAIHAFVVEASRRAYERQN